MTKVYSIALFLSLSTSTAFAAWDGTGSPWTNGDGTMGSPYLIENEQQLEYFRKSVTDGETYVGKFVKLTVDLDMSADKGMTFNPIGFHNVYTLDNKEYDESKAFLGTFDGGYHTIDNANIALATPDTDGIGGVGLFACAYKGTVIKNVILGSKSTVNGSESADVAGIVGICYGGSIIVNCMNAATILGGSFETGGITGYAADNTIINGCINKGTITAHSSTGGIVGNVQNATITRCYSTGPISAEGAYWVGGIAGQTYRGSVESCYSISPMTGQTGSSYMPGIRPIVSDADRTSVNICYYVEALCGCKSTTNNTGVHGVTTAELSNEATLAALNEANFINDNQEATWVAGADGYPTLKWASEINAGIGNVSAETVAAVISVSDGSITVTTDAVNAVFTVYDTAGHVVYSAPVADGQASCTPAAGSVYIAVVATPEGKSVRKISL